MTAKTRPVVTLVAICGILVAICRPNQANSDSASLPLHALQPPASGVVNVAFIVSDQTTLIDLAGPWDVFVSTMLTSQGRPWHGGKDMTRPFRLYTVSDSQKPISVDGLTIVPNFTFANAPGPQIIVIPAQGGRSESQKEWVLENAKTADVTMSVCVGASILSAYGLLDHQQATTHFMFLEKTQKKYPAVEFVTGLRYVDNGKVATSAGETAGIDLALHMVERYYGREVAQSTADFMEYRGELWKNPQYGEVKPVGSGESH